MRNASVLGLFLAVLAFLFIVPHLAGVRPTFVSTVPAAHVDIANWVPILFALLGGIVLTVGVAIVGYGFMHGR